MSFALLCTAIVSEAVIKEACDALVGWFSDEGKLTRERCASSTLLCVEPRSPARGN